MSSNSDKEPEVLYPDSGLGSPTPVKELEALYEQGGVCSSPGQDLEVLYPHGAAFYPSRRREPEAHYPHSPSVNSSGSSASIFASRTEVL